MDEAILRGVVKHIHQCFPDQWNEKNCKAMIDGRPDPISGIEFCSVHITEFQGATDDQGLLREVWGFGVTISKRNKAVPFDRLNEAIYLEDKSGLARLSNRIKFAINNRYEVSNSIQSCIPTEEDDPKLYQFIECLSIRNPPLLSSRTPKVRERDEEWWHGSHSLPQRNKSDGHVGLSLTLNFGSLNILIKQTEGNC